MADNLNIWIKLIVKYANFILDSFNNLIFILYLKICFLIYLFSFKPNMEYRLNILTCLYLYLFVCINIPGSPARCQS